MKNTADVCCSVSSRVCQANSVGHTKFGSSRFGVAVLTSASTFFPGLGGFGFEAEADDSGQNGPSLLSAACFDSLADN